MTIALDATYSVGRHLSGVGVYSRELLTGLAASHPAQRFLHCYRPHRLWRGLHVSGLRTRPLAESLPLFSAHLFHGLNQRLPRHRLRRAVSTFHDLFVLTAEYSTPEFRARFAAQARDAAQRSDLIIAVSAFTASQVESLLAIPSSRLRVVPHGVRFSAAPATPREKIVLHVGALQTRKNILRLLAAFEHAAPPDWRLVLAGSDGYGAAEIHARIARSPCRPRITVTGWIPDAELESWYDRAAVLAFVSLDEGFGIPALEAMARGAAVLSSRGTALEEVCGPAALLVDPHHGDEITEALRTLMLDDDLRTRYAARGLARARLYPWSRAVDETWRVYQELL